MQISSNMDKSLQTSEVQAQLKDQVKVEQPKADKPEEKAKSISAAELQTKETETYSATGKSEKSAESSTEFVA